MADKFNRKYKLIVSNSDGTKTVNVQLPFTIEFDIARHTLTSSNVCQVRLYNLSEDNRSFLRWNNFDTGNDPLLLSLRAGYGNLNNLSEIFSGAITRAWSVREGVNFITQIECFDGGFATVNGKTNTTFVGGTPYSVVIRTLMSTLPLVTVGAIGNFLGEVPPGGKTFSGNTLDILAELTGGGFFVDNGVAYALKTSEYYIGTTGLTVINAQSGLLGTPLLEVSSAHFEMIFEPTLSVGQLAQVISTTDKFYNRIYKITGVKHRGTISGAVSGSVTTTGEFFYDQELLGVAI